MKNCISFAALVAAGLFLGPQAKAQCPANINPLQILTGSWAFKQEGLAPPGEGAAGRFTASLGTDRAGNTIGVLTVTSTFNFFSEHAPAR